MAKDVTLSDLHFLGSSSLAGADLVKWGMGRRAVSTSSSTAVEFGPRLLSDSDFMRGSSATLVP